LDDRLQVFKKEYCFTKEEIEKYVADFIDSIRNNEEDYSSVYHLKAFLELCERFQQTLSKAKLPALTEDWWFYDVKFTGDSISLTLNKAENAELNNYGGISMFIDEVYVLLEVKCDYLTVEEYASSLGVKDITVRQWIRRGKLRHAKKFGNTWLIPAICKRPSRGFKEVLYEWDYLPDELINKFPILAGASSIFIEQDENNKSNFLCHVGYLFMEKPPITLSKSEVEKLEIALIAEPSVRASVL